MHLFSLVHLFQADSKIKHTLLIQVTSEVQGSFIDSWYMLVHMKCLQSLLSQRCYLTADVGNM